MKTKKTPPKKPAAKGQKPRRLVPVLGSVNELPSTVSAALEHRNRLTHHTRKTAQPCWGLDEKLDALRHCIAEGHDEDAQGHLFDLLSALRLRSGIKGVYVTDLTPEGHRSLALLSPNASDQTRRAQD